MASDITLAVGDGVRRMTYAELAEARDISLRSARQLTLRHRWHKQVGNDGLVVVSVPLSALRNSQKIAKSAEGTSEGTSAGSDVASEAPSGGTSQRDEAPSEVASDPTRVFEAALTMLREQLDHERARADRAEQRNDELQSALIVERRRVLDILTGPTQPWWRKWFR